MTSHEGSPEREVRQRLRELRVDLPDGGFEASLHRRLVEAGPPVRGEPWWRAWLGPTPSRRWAWPLAGGAAGIAALALVMLLRAGPAGPGGGAGDDRIAATQVPSTRVAVVRVNLSADVAVASAEIRVSLPDGLVFWSDGAALPQRSFAWQQPLAAGSNEIPIAVRGERPGRYLVKISTRVDGAVLEHEIPLEVTAG